MKIRFQRKTFTITLVAIAIFLLICLTYIPKEETPPDDLYCYHHHSTSLPSILDSNPAKGKSIFFHETSCNSDKHGKIVITARQACAVESAAKLNPNFEVYMLYVSPGVYRFDDDTDSDRFLKALMTYQNVKIRHLDFGAYLEGTPVESLYKEGKIERSRYPMSHASDVLRYLTLWKYGGIYLDLDVVVIKPLENLPLNYAGAESNALVAAGVLSFSPTGAGHILATMCVKDLRDNFSGELWVNNGPGVVTRLAKRLCASEDVPGTINALCLGNFTVYPPKAFYPVHYWNATQFFDEKYIDEVKKVTKDSYVVHFWNKLSEGWGIPAHEEVPYTVFAREFCPKVYSECRGNF